MRSVLSMIMHIKILDQKRRGGQLSYGAVAIT